MRHLIILASLLLMPVCLSGCAELFHPAGLVGSPDLPDADEEIDALVERYFTDDIIANYVSDNPGDRDGLSHRDYRNRVVSARMHVIDYYYNRFVQLLYTQRQSRNIVLESVGLGLTAASSVVGGLGAAQALGAAATGVGGLNSTLDAELYYDRALPAIITQMDAGRQRARAQLLTGLQLPDTEYSLFLALSDLDNYYRAGSLIGAIARITEDSGVALSVAESQVADVYRPSEVAPSPAQHLVINRIVGLINQLQPDRARELAVALPVPVDPENSRFAESRNRAFRTDGTVSRRYLVSIFSRENLEQSESDKLIACLTEVLEHPDQPVTVVAEGGRR